MIKKKQKKKPLVRMQKLEQARKQLSAGDTNCLSSPAVLFLMTPVICCLSPDQSLIIMLLSLV